jgi:replication factor A1
MTEQDSRAWYRRSQQAAQRAATATVPRPPRTCLWVPEGLRGRSESLLEVTPMSTTETVQSIEAQFENSDVSIDSADVKARLNTLVREYQVPVDEAERSVVNSLLDDHDIDRSRFYGHASSGNALVGCGEVTQDEQWVDVQAKVVDLWEPNSDAIAQVGLLGDESGTIKFVSFTTSNLPELEEDAVYRLGNVVTDEYEGRFSVKLNKTTEIEPLDRSIEVGDDTETVTGALVAIQPGSGLIRRCPDEDCTRVLNNGRCAEHGEQNGEFDLRIKAILDDGGECHRILFNQAATEAISDLTMEAAKEAAMDALNTDIVAEQLAHELIGRYFELDGAELGQYFLVEEATEIDAPTDSDVAALLKTIDDTS